MALHRSELPEDLLALLRRGAVIPAHPVALDSARALDPRRQRALTRYYVDAGAGGLAVGVHPSPPALRDAGLYEPVLALAARTARESTTRPLVLIAGLSGDTGQAAAEARLAVGHGYHCGMLTLSPMPGASIDERIAHCEAVAAEIPLIGVCPPTDPGGHPLPVEFWRRFAAIDNVVAIRVAPLDRYRTLEVARGVVLAGADSRVTLYTGNDDHIVLDLLAPLAVRRLGVDGPEEVRVRIRGGLLGHWSVWTQGAVRLFERIGRAIEEDRLDDDLLALDSRVTDCNAAFFDVAHGFAGRITGCHEVLRRQGLLAGIECLDPAEDLSPGQAAEIDRVCREHADLGDDDFVRTHLDRWLAD